MPFSASTCLTYTGSTQLGGVFNIYSDVSGSTPIHQGILLSEITSPNCPYVFEVPDGTSIVYLVDELTGCQLTSPIVSSNFCVTCDLDFNLPLSGTVGVLSVGSLTGSCENPITDYLFTWYGPNDFTLSAFTSGPSGSAYNPMFQHPLTGTSQPPVLAGTYKPVLEKVVLSGITFTPSGGSGTVSANLDCFGTISVDAYNCGNGGTNTLTNVDTGSPRNFAHRLNYTTNYFTQPQPLRATFVLSANTNYFPYAFKGESVPDTLKITYSGVNYTQPYILEYLNVGSDLTNNAFSFGLNLMPKSADTAGYVRRVLCFTGFTNKQEGDVLIIDVIPNTGNTNWDFYFSCLETFDCSNCFENFKNSSYKISGSTITATTVDGLSSIIKFVVSGCPWNNNSSFSITKTDFANYTNISDSGGWLNTSVSPYNISPYTYRERTTADLFFPGTYIRSCTRPTLPASPPASGGTCTQNLGELIKVNKTSGNILFEFSDFNDFNAYYQSYLDKMQYSGTPSNSSDPNYYRMLVLTYPTATTNQQCGDGFSYATLYIHPSSIVTTADTFTGYSLNLTLPTITNVLGNYSGYNCKLWFDNIVNNVNLYSTGITHSYLNQNGLRRNDPFWWMFYVDSTGSPPGGGVTATTLYTQFFSWEYEYNTYAYSSTTASSLLTSFSAKTCNNFGAPNNGGVSIFPYVFQTRLTNPADTNDFQIWASPINNYVYSGYPAGVTLASLELAYEISGGIVIYSDPDYII